MPKLLWTERTDFGPSPRSASSATWDSNRGRTVLFGGNTGSKGDNGETWEWDGSNWTQMSEIGPGARAYSALAYDSVNKVSLLFAGRSGNTLTHDTWQWDGVNWTQLSETGPQARIGHALAYDSVRKCVVLFGGATGVGPTGDTWEFDGQDWTQQQDSGPSARTGHGMAFDSVNGRIVLFGGAGSDGNGLADTWAWDGQEWVEIGDFGPPSRLNASLVSIGGAALILYGGESAAADGSQVFSDTWQFDGKLWTQLSNIGPGSLQSAATAFDAKRNAVVLFGGLSTVSTVDANLSGHTWESIVVPGGAPDAGTVRVTSITIPSPVVQEAATTMTLTLSAPALIPTLVQLTGPVFSTVGANKPNETIPAGLTTFSDEIAFAPVPNGQQEIQITVSAQVAGTPAVSTTVTVTAT